MPGGLHARLCHTFLVCYFESYRSMHSLKLHNVSLTVVKCLQNNFYLSGSTPTEDVSLISAVDVAVEQSNGMPN